MSTPRTKWHVSPVDLADGPITVTSPLHGTADFTVDGGRVIADDEAGARLLLEAFPRAEVVGPEGAALTPPTGPGAPAGGDAGDDA